jgi:hypothetical protein
VDGRAKPGHDARNYPAITSAIIMSCGLTISSFAE